METITIQGADFTVAPRYSEGHVLTANEAATLNQTLFENLRNNFAKQVKDAKGEAESLTAEQVTELQAKLDAYAASYAFGIRTSAGPRAPADPVGKEAFNLAKEAVKNAIRKQGKNPSDYPAAQINELAKGALEKHNAMFMEKARAAIAQREALADDILGGDAPAPEAQPEEAAPAAPKKGRKAAA